MGVIAPAEGLVKARRRLLPAGSAWARPLAIVGIAIAAVWVVIAIAAPLLAPDDPLATNVGPAHTGPTWHHLFGTDELGRDVLSRVMYGSRQSLPVALLLVGLALLIGGTLGALAGYFGGFVDGLIMRATDLVFAFPAIILAMVVTAALGPNLTNAVFALVIVSWPSYARVVRGLVRSLKESDYVSATRLLRLVGAQRAAARRAAERARPGRRARDARPRQRDPAALGPLVPRPRLAAADARVGRGRRRGDPVLPVLVDRRVPGLRDLHRGARVQPARRQPARRARPARRRCARRTRRYDDACSRSST